jgi:LAO/AO transport system kinase
MGIVTTTYADDAKGLHVSSGHCERRPDARWQAPRLTEGFHRHGVRVTAEEGAAGGPLVAAEESVAAERAPTAQARPQDPERLTRRYPRRAADIPDLVGRARNGDPRAVARLVSFVEDGAAGSPVLRVIMRAVAPLAGKARVLGLTGAPGVGKSTTTSALVRAYRRRGVRVGVLAVDPSSPFTGGALLGDRVRMQDHATDHNVFIRSMATRGHLGGLASATPQALRVLDAAGFDVIMIETVGVGQAEVEVASLADTTLVLVAPGMGDAIQAAKAGILEVGDVFVVNKADRDGAQQAIRDLRNMVALADWDESRWKPPIVATVAAREEGIGELTAKLDAHAAWLDSSGELLRRRQARAGREVTAIAVAELRARMGVLPGAARLGRLAAKVADGELDPYSAADELVASVSPGAATDPSGPADGEGLADPSGPSGPAG